MESMKVVLYQKPLGIEIPESDREEMREFGPDFVCFPEYFFVNRELGNHGQTAENQERQIRRIRDLSQELTAVVIGGTMPEMDGGRLYNTCFIYDNGEPLGFYRKRNLFHAETGKVTPGNDYKTFTARGLRFGVLICSDVFYRESFVYMRRERARVIFSPTFSLKKEETVEDKYLRDQNIYVEGARISGAVIVKVCGVKSEYKDFLQARSLIASGDGILFRVRPEEEATPMIIKQVVPL